MSDKKDKKEEKVEEKNTAQESVLAYRFLAEPRITEKSHEMMSSSKYVFKVRNEANKKNVKRSIETLYGVKVENVNIINVPSKRRNYGRIVGSKPGYKKAVITLKEGDKIDLFEGA